MSDLGKLTPDADGISFLVEQFPQEELCDELQQYLEEEVGNLGACIRHPLVYSMLHMPMFNGRVNKQLQYKKEALRVAEEEGRYHTYVFLHERPYRLKGFQDIADRTANAEYWDLLSEIWTDSENIRQNQREWIKLLRSKRPGRENMMSEEDREALAAMRDVIPVYQGHTLSRHDGWSWTTERSKAEWFARRFAMMEDDTAMLSIGTVAKRHVTAYLTNRGESEILVDRNRVEISRTIRVSMEGTFSSAMPMTSGSNTSTNGEAFLT